MWVLEKGNEMLKTEHVGSKTFKGFEDVEMYCICDCFIHFYKQLVSDTLVLLGICFESSQFTGSCQSSH